jgi:hypothetical protein
VPVEIHTGASSQRILNGIPTAAMAQLAASKAGPPASCRVIMATGV